MLVSSDALKELRKETKFDFGRAGEFRTMYKKCYSNLVSGYQYTVCPFDKVLV